MEYASTRLLNFVIEYLGKSEKVRKSVVASSNEPKEGLLSKEKVNNLVALTLKHHIDTFVKNLSLNLAQI